MLRRMLALLAAGLCLWAGALAEEDVLLEDAAVPSPSTFTCGDPTCYWETPMDITDTARVWAMLTRPMTVISGSQKEQIALRAAPEADAARVGEITCDSQGVHVLEQTEDGWSFIECYSSSFAGSRVGAWNRLVRGYVPTDRLTDVEIRTAYGMVVDKLTQRLYLFKDGELYDTLAVSTGYAAKDKPFNETRSGEFRLISAVGEFPSGDMRCSYGIRFNAGDILHEVPYIPREDGSKNYAYTERYLGEKASHGCVRVQRLLTAKGTNMKWIWKNRQDMLGIRMVIWEDLPGRSIAVPDGATPLYYNPKGGKYYHGAETCYGVKDQYLPLTAFRYDELEESPYSKLKACPNCVPPRRAAEIEAINAVYAE